MPYLRTRCGLSKITEQTCKTFVDLLKATNISKGDSNWTSWEGYFGSIVDTLELKHWLYQGVPIPLTMQDLLVIYADNDIRVFENESLPNLYRDTLGRVTIRYHRDLLSTFYQHTVAIANCFYQIVSVSAISEQLN